MNTPSISVLFRVTDELSRSLDDTVSAATASGDVEVIVVDATSEGAGSCGTVTRIREPSPCRTKGWNEALRRARGEYIAFADSRCRSLPGRWGGQAQQLHDHPEADLVIGGASVDGHARELGEALWMARSLFRRSVLQNLDEVTFFPVELAVLHDLEQRKRVLREATPVIECDSAAQASATAQHAEDSRLLDLLTPPDRCCAPELSVLISTYNRRRTLLRCLESFARQAVPAGTFEIIVTDDDSPDGTGDLIAPLRLAVPFKFLRRPRGGLAEARNEGFAVAEGRWILIVNDDTIAAPDLVAEHLATHRRLAPEKVSVLGAFDQSEAVLAGALMRAIEHTSFGFPFEGMRSGQFYNWHKFWTCNLSVPADAIRQVGGMDEDYECYGCEDSDMGLRLEQLGYSVYYHDQAKALHDHTHDLEGVRKRQTTLAQANVRFFAKNPQQLDEPNWKWLLPLSQASCQELVERQSPLTRRLEAAARQLSQLDLSAIGTLGESFASLSSQIELHLKQLLQELNKIWWAQGTAAGLRALDVEGYASLRQGGRAVADCRSLRFQGPVTEPWPVNTQAGVRVLTWPVYAEAQLRDFFAEYGRALLEVPNLCLCLRHDDLVDVPLEDATRRLQQVFDDLFGVDEDLEVLMITERLTAHDWARLGKSTPASLLLPATDNHRRTFLQGVADRTLSNSGQLRTWLEAFSSGPPARATAENALSLA